MFPIFIPLFYSTSSISDDDAEEIREMQERAKDNRAKIINFLTENKNKNVTATDIACAIGIEKFRVDGCVTAMQKRGQATRIIGERVDENGNKHKVKYIKLT